MIHPLPPPSKAHSGTLYPPDPHRPNPIRSQKCIVHASRVRRHPTVAAENARHHTIESSNRLKILPRAENGEAFVRCSLCCASWYRCVPQPYRLVVSGSYQESRTSTYYSLPSPHCPPKSPPCGNISNLHLRK